MHASLKNIQFFLLLVHFFSKDVLVFDYTWNPNWYLTFLRSSCLLQLCMHPSFVCLLAVSIKSQIRSVIDEKGHFLVGILVLSGKCNAFLCREDSSRLTKGENWLVHVVLLMLVKSGWSMVYNFMDWDCNESWISHLTDTICYLSRKWIVH